MDDQKEGIWHSTTCVWNGTMSDWRIQWQHSSMRIHQMFDRSKLTFYLGRARSGIRKAIGVQLLVVSCQGYSWRISSHQLSSFNNTKIQSSPWHEKANKVPSSIVFLRTVVAYCFGKFCVDFKIKHQINIQILFYTITILSVCLIIILYLVMLYCNVTILQIYCVMLQFCVVSCYYYF